VVPDISRPKILQTSKSIDGSLSIFSGKKYISWNNSRICMFVCTMVLHEYMNLLGSRMMFIICSNVRMCELKYIGNFIKVLFIWPIKDVMLELRNKSSECDWLFLWQHKLCATFSTNVSINYRLPIKVYYPAYLYS
jgi:hypothetical protein